MPPDSCPVGIEEVLANPGDGTEISYEFKTPIKGRAGTVVKGAGFDAVSAKHINSTERETRLMQGAKEVRIPNATTIPSEMDNNILLTLPLKTAMTAASTP